LDHAARPPRERCRRRGRQRRDQSAGGGCVRTPPFLWASPAPSLLVVAARLSTVAIVVAVGLRGVRG